MRSAGAGRVEEVTIELDRIRPQEPRPVRVELAARVVVEERRAAAATRQAPLFKTEQQAYSSSLFFTPTFDSFREVFARSNYFSFAWNSILISVGVTVLCLILAVPAAYAMAFFPTRRTQKVLLWMLSTKMMPSVGVLVPIYLLWKNSGLLDVQTGTFFLSGGGNSTGGVFNAASTGTIDFNSDYGLDAGSSFTGNARRPA